MASSLFGATPSLPTQEANQNPQIQLTVNDDTVSIVEEAIKESGGNAKDAFYKLAKKKGINANEFLKSLEGVGDIRSLATKMLMSNPRIGGLFNLMSMMK